MPMVGKHFSSVYNSTGSLSESVLYPFLSDRICQVCPILFLAYVKVFLFARGTNAAIQHLAASRSVRVSGLVA